MQKFIFSRILPIAEIFFIERMYELTNLESIDSYRYRINNPKSSLIELKTVLRDYLIGKVINFETVRNLIEEVGNFMVKEDFTELHEEKIKKEEIEYEESYLVFKSIDKRFFLLLLKELLKKGAKNDEESRKDCSKLEAALHVIIKDNTEYLKTLLDSTLNTIKEINDDFSKIEQLNSLLGYLTTELINIGIHRTHLNSDIWSKFYRRMKGINNYSFEDLYTTFSTKFYSSANERSIIYRLEVPRRIQSDLNILNTNVLSVEEIREYKIGFNATNDAKAFFNQENNKYIEFKTTAIDDIAGLDKTRNELALILDSIYFGFHQSSTALYKRALIIDKDSNIAKTKPIFHVPEGAYDKGQLVYQKFYDQIFRINNDNMIAKDAKDKVLSAIRYLRIGSEAINVEQKFINYWLGLEYLFSNYETKSTIVRIKQFLMRTHCNSYIERKFKDFHSTLLKLNIEDIPNFNNDLNYLKQVDTYLYIEENYRNTNPLVVFRALELKKIVESQRQGRTSAHLEIILNKHRKNILWNLTRAYRIRNEIVHDAGRNMNIESITNHIRYYLIFMINKLLDYFTEHTS